jgi:hypothetical protein
MGAESSVGHDIIRMYLEEIRRKCSHPVVRPCGQSNETADSGKCGRIASQAE